MNCVNCDRSLIPVFTGSEELGQFENALDVTLHLGYGEFADAEPDTAERRTAHFCCACATEMVARFPGIKKMIS